MQNKEINTKPIEAKTESFTQKISSITTERKIINSFKSGIFAFSIVLVLCSMFKVLAVTAKSTSNFEITGNDLIFSFWAFIVISFIEISHYFKS